MEIAGAAENTAWLNSVEFYLENEDGEQFRPISNGVSATGDPDSPAMLSFRLESPYFAQSEHLTLHITNATWLDKDLERIRVDLERKYMDRTMEGVRLIAADKRESGWVLTFRVKRIKENHSFSIVGTTFYDEQGSEYSMRSQSSSASDIDGYFEMMIPLPDYHKDVVWLEPNFSRRSDCDPSITIPIK